jgi:hypothetical protein
VSDDCLDAPSSRALRRGIIDPGHQYMLPSLDGYYPQRLTFVKRCDLANPARFPGNKDAYPGTTVQMVVRTLLDRLRYLQGQHWCLENVGVIFALRSVLWLMEFRAARRHGRRYFKSLSYAENAPLCPECGHTICEHQ